MKETRLKLRTTGVAAIAATIASTFIACSGDDNATTPLVDSGTASSSAAAHDSGSSTSSTSTTTDSGTADSSTGSSSSTTSDAGNKADADAAPPLPAIVELDWCSLLLFDFYDSPGTGTHLPDGGFQLSACANNPSCFANQMLLDQGNPQSYIPAMQADCHFGGLAAILQANNDGGPNSASAWFNQVIAFAMGLFNCTQPDLGQIDAGDATIRDLLPPGQANTTLTQADVNALVNTFATAVYTEVAVQDLVDSNGGTLLTADQMQELQDLLNAIAAATPNVTPSLTTYTYNTCPTDAGSD